MVSWYCQFLLSGLQRRTGKGFRLVPLAERLLDVLRSEGGKRKTSTLPIGFHNLVYFVNFAVEPTSSDESRQFPEGEEGLC